MTPSCVSSDTHVPFAVHVERARPRAAHERIATYHERQLKHLLERVRDGFARMNVSRSTFDLDEVIHRCQRSAREL